MNRKMNRTKLLPGATRVSPSGPPIFSYMLRGSDGAEPSKQPGYTNRIGTSPHVDLADRRRQLETLRDFIARLA
jgi:hypothetical protein